MVISKYTNNRDNNFNIIRFIAAILVLYSHSYPLYGYKFIGPVEQFFGKSWGGLAVHVFFISSGFLIMGSFVNSKSIGNFIVSRLLRIYPALIVSVLFCVFILGFSTTTVKAELYIKDNSIWDFLLYNSLLVVGNIRYGLIGVFSNIPYPNAVNGSLWTLPHEVKMYFYLLVSASILSLFSKLVIKQERETLFKYFYFLVFVVVLGVFFSKEYFELNNLTINTITLLIMFLIGVNFYNFKNKIQLKLEYLALAIFTLLFFAVTNKIFFNYLYVFLIPYILFYCVYVPKGKIRNFNKIGDYSYGIYIYAFPIQQLVIYSFPKISFSLFIVISIVFTGILSMFSWHFIEKPALSMKKKIVATKSFTFLKFNNFIKAPSEYPKPL